MSQKCDWKPPMRCFSWGARSGDESSSNKWWTKIERPNFCEENRVAASHQWDNFCVFESPFRRVKEEWVVKESCQRLDGHFRMRMDSQYQGFSTFICSSGACLLVGNSFVTGSSCTCSTCYGCWQMHSSAEVCSGTASSGCLAQTQVRVWVHHVSKSVIFCFWSGLTTVTPSFTVRCCHIITSNHIESHHFWCLYFARPIHPCLCT